MSGQAPRVGYYVHHHGGGHAARALAVASRMRHPVTFLTSSQAGFPRHEVIRLPLDTDAGIEGHEHPRELHFAPTGSRGLSRRMASIASWIAGARPSLFVVDVSVEVTMLARLCGARVAVVRQHGDRRDPPHELAHRWANDLVAPFPDWFEDPSASPELIERTAYAGGISRFDGEPRPESPAAAGNGQGRALLVAGRDSRFVALASDIRSGAPGWEVEVVGAPGQAGSVTHDALARADVVVGACGSNLVAEASHARRGLVTWPQHRPFGEQEARAQLLQREGMAAVVGEAPPPSAWPGLMGTALDRSEALSALCDGEGSARAARRLDSWASGRQAADAERTSSTPAPGSHLTRPSSARRSSHPGAGHSPHFEKKR